MPSAMGGALLLPVRGNAASSHGILEMHAHDSISLYVSEDNDQMEQKNPKLVLQVMIGGNTFSGVASYLYEYYKCMDHAKVHYDFCFCRQNSMEIKANDPVFSESKFYVLNAVKNGSNDYPGIMKGLKEILRNTHYDAVVVNTSIIAVIAACRLAVPSRSDTRFIAHAHNTDLILGKGAKRNKMPRLMAVLDRIGRRYIRENSDYLFACTDDAGAMTFGKEALGLPKFRIVRNAIDLDRFSFDEDTRRRVREEFSVGEQTTLYGNVGSFCKRKNQLFLVDAFNELVQKQPDSELWLIGDGEYRPLLEKAIRQYHLEEKVKILGQRNDVHKLMQAMDCFVFSTISEGLGIVAIEAQATGLYTIVSDGVPSDVLITEGCKQLKLNSGAANWAVEMQRENIPSMRYQNSETIRSKGYAIRDEAVRLEEFYSGFDCR